MSAVHQFQVDERKIRFYLLNPVHKRGASKAKFFLGRGFSVGDVPAMATALTRHASANWPGVVSSNDYGDRHAVVAPMLCPDGTSPRVLTVWQVEPGSVVARFVTAYPQV